jgi:rubrerythrin
MQRRDYEKFNYCISSKHDEALPFPKDVWRCPKCGSILKSKPAHNKRNSKYKPKFEGY